MNELHQPGFRVRHPADAEVTTGSVETREHRVRTVRIRGPWVTSASEPGVGTRYEVRILIFEDPTGGRVGDLLAEGRLPSHSARFRLVRGRLGGREAVIREPHDRGVLHRAAYVHGERRFYFVEWRGPAEPILETLELDS